MIVTVVLMLVFFVLGLSVLTAASGASAGINARIGYRQAYYLARSTLDALDESLRYGELGEQIRDYERDRAGYVGDVSWPLSLSFGENAPGNAGFADGAALTYRVVSYVLPGEGGAQPQVIYVSISDAALTFRTVSGDKTYGVHVTYQYDGWGTQDSEGIWTWEGEWRLRSMA